MTQSRFVMAAEVCSDLGICSVTLWRWIEAGKFPAPLRFGRRRVWLRHEYDAHIQEVAERRLAN